MIETTFTVGQVVRATSNAQGLRKGQTYRIVRVEELPSAFGNFVRYHLRPHDWFDASLYDPVNHVTATLPVLNGHLLLEAIS